MTIKLGNLFGLHLRIMRGSDDKRYLCAVIWYLRAPRRLGYLYPSVRWF